MMRGTVRRVRDAFSLRRPAHRRVIEADRTGVRLPVRSWVEHREAAMQWLARAQDATRTGLLSAGYCLKTGRWRPAYPEVTGYTIATFLDAADREADSQWEERARAAGEGLLRLQARDGSFPGGWVTEARGPSVFNTGQILLGLTRLHQRTSQPEFGAAAERAARWLVSCLDEDGAWRRFAYGGRPHTYYAMVAWALVEWGAAAGDPACERAARRHLEWIAGRRHPDGWIDDLSFDGNPEAFTHTIGYALQGLLACAARWRDEDLVRSVAGGAGALREAFARDGRLAARYGPGWRPVGHSACLTGDCQIALVWLDLARAMSQPGWTEPAEALLRSVAETQRLEFPDARIRGGIKGSHPIWGEYQPYTYPVWAAKFFCDAILALFREEPGAP